MYKDLNGEILIVGFDVYFCDRVGDGISYVYDLLKDIGFKYVFIFDKRKMNGIFL